MRWLVEVSSLGKTDTQKFCVEAESWQRALQAARSQRGEDGPMSGFSIELLEEGYRAVDPLARVRFVVKKAPDDMAITAAPAKEATRVSGVAPAAPAASNAPSSGAASAAVKAAIAAPAAKAAVAPPAPVGAAPAITSAPNSPPPAGSTDATTPNLPPAPSSSSVSGKKAPPRPGQSQPPPPGSGAGLLTVTADSKKKNETMVFSSSGDASVAEKPVKRALPPAVGSSIPGLPPVKLLTSREQNPNDASPLTYREYAFAVPDGTSEESAAEVLRAQLRYVEAHIATAKTGKLVNLAVFDIEFTGKPPRAPLATLTWKDWKGEPVLGFPRRGGAQSKPPRPPSKMPASLGASPAAIPQAPPVPQNLGLPVPQAAQAAVTGPQSTQPISPQDSQQAQQAVAAAQLAQQQQAQFAQQQARLAQQQAQPTFPLPQGFQQAPAGNPFQQVPAGNPFQQPAAHQAPHHVPPAGAHAFAPVAPPEPTFSEAPPAPRKQPSSSNHAVEGGMVKTPSGRYVRGRVSGDELITSLFESMHDLHFLRDALDGGQFCLALATEVLPARAGIIHFFDIEKREWVVACTRGKDMGRLLTMRAPENDEILRECARKRRALVVPDAAHVTSERYRQLNGARSLIAAPIMQAGRALGALEIINPLDGMPFTEDEGNAMTYIAEQFAEYLGSRGIVLDRERIHSAAAAR